MLDEVLISFGVLVKSCGDCKCGPECQCTPDKCGDCCKKNGCCEEQCKSKLGCSFCYIYLTFKYTSL